MKCGTPHRDQKAEQNGREEWLMPVWITPSRLLHKRFGTEQAALEFKRANEEPDEAAKLQAAIEAAAQRAEDLAEAVDKVLGLVGFPEEMDVAKLLAKVDVVVDILNDMAEGES